MSTALSNRSEEAGMAKVCRIDSVKSLYDGCMFVLGEGRNITQLKDGNAKVDYYTIYCGKVRSSQDSALCPHHEAIVSDLPLADERRKEALRARREYKQQLEDDLRHSPLAAVNPNVQDGSTYGR